MYCGKGENAYIMAHLSGKFDSSPLKKTILCNPYVQVWCNYTNVHVQAHRVYIYARNTGNRPCTPFQRNPVGMWHYQTTNNPTITSMQDMTMYFIECHLLTSVYSMQLLVPVRTLSVFSQLLFFVIGSDSHTGKISPEGLQLTHICTYVYYMFDRVQRHNCSMHIRTEYVHVYLVYLLYGNDYSPQRCTYYTYWIYALH